MKIPRPFIITILIIFLIAGVMYFLPKVQRSENNMEDMGHEHVIDSHNSYHIELTNKTPLNHIPLNAPVTISYKIKNNNGETIKNFAVAHEKLMHFIIVRKDITQFQHLHPMFDKITGEFSVDVIFTADGPYRFFADFTSGDDPLALPIVVSSDINFGDMSKFQPQPLVLDTQSKKTVQPDYQVTYAFPDSMKSQEPLLFSLLIEKTQSQPVSLENYLGALGHSVIIKEGTLEYIHAHPEEQKNDQPQNNITFMTTLPDIGKYKIFTEFQEHGRVSISDYTLEVK